MISKNIIKFKQGDLKFLRSNILKDLSSEFFAVLFAKRESIRDYEIFNVYEVKFPKNHDYKSQGLTHLNLKKEYVHQMLREITSRYDVDTIVDVHTHPFSKKHVSFSSIDDRDEIQFFKFIRDKFEGLFYASIVFSQEEYSARIWKGKTKYCSEKAIIKTQTILEEIKSSDFPLEKKERYENNVFGKDGFFNRSLGVMGLETLRQIINNQIITVVGVGGTGSIVSEHLVHMGFHKINLVDNDNLEISNMNRIVGAYFEDAKKNKPKVNVIKNHLSKINPNASIYAFNNDIYDEEIEITLALSDWIILSTDNHSSRFYGQEIAFKYFVPFISLGVNITINNNNIEDMSGEVITARIGDYYCLTCLGRLNHMKIVSERNPEATESKELVSKGYIKNIKEPAVKTLNSITATVAVDALVNQYTNYQKHQAIVVYENNSCKSIYSDNESLKSRGSCSICNI